MAEVKVRIEAYCSAHRGCLKAKTDPYGKGGTNVIYVEPCPECLAEVRAEGEEGLAARIQQIDDLQSWIDDLRGSLLAVREGYATGSARGWKMIGAALEGAELGVGPGPGKA